MKKERNLRKLNNKGFSLVELIIVIAIMAILVAIIVPNFLQYLDKARKVRDLEMARVLGTAMERVLALDEAAGKEWQNLPDNVIWFEVRDPETGKKYKLINCMEWTLTAEGDIDANSYHSEDNARNGILRDAHRSGDHGGGAGINTNLYNAYAEELAQYDINIFYRKYNIRQYRVLKRADNGKPEVWVCAVKPRTDGEGRNGFLYYRLWPDYNPEYLMNKKPVVAANANNAGRTLE